VKNIYVLKLFALLKSIYYFFFKIESASLPQKRKELKKQKQSEGHSAAAFGFPWRLAVKVPWIIWRFANYQQMLLKRRTSGWWAVGRGWWSKRIGRQLCEKFLSDIFI